MRLRIYNGFGCIWNKPYASVKSAKIAMANIQRRFNNHDYPYNYLVADITISNGNTIYDYTTSKKWEKLSC